MSNEDMKSIFEQINNLKKPVSESREEMIDNSQDTLHEVLSEYRRKYRECWMKIILHRRICAVLRICPNLILAKYKMVK